MEMSAHLAVLLELLLFLVFLGSTSSSAQKEMKEETEQMISVGDLIIFLSKQILFLVFHKAPQIAARPTNKWNFPAKGM